jgi:hypothetical protein
MTKPPELQLAERPAWGFWAALACLALLGAAAIWGAITAPNPAAAWFFGGGAAFCIGLSCLGGYALLRPATIFVEHGTLVARTPFSVRKLALAEVDHLELRRRRTRGGIAHRELVVAQVGRMRPASIVADDFSDSRIAAFAKAAGLRFKPEPGLPN